MSILTIPSGFKEHISLANEIHKQKEDEKLRLVKERNNLVFENFVNCINSLLAKIKESYDTQSINIKMGNGINNFTWRDVLNISKHPKYEDLKGELLAENIQLFDNTATSYAYQPAAYNVKMMFKPGSSEHIIVME